MFSNQSLLMATVLRAPNRPTAARSDGAALAPGSVVKGNRLDSVLKAGKSSYVYRGVDPQGAGIALKEFFPQLHMERKPSG